MSLRLPSSLFLLALCLLVAVEGKWPVPPDQNYANPSKTQSCDHPPPPPPPCDHSEPPSLSPYYPPYTPTPSPIPVETPPPPTSYSPPPIVTPSPSPSTPSTPPTPSGPRSHRGYCVPQCQQRCKKSQRRIRVCVRVCAQCCEKNNRCVPSENESCPNWNTVIYHGIEIKCP